MLHVRLVATLEVKVADEPVQIGNAPAGVTAGAAGIGVTTAAPNVAVAGLPVAQLKLEVNLTETISPGATVVEKVFEEDVCIIVAPTLNSYIGVKPGFTPVAV